jgi:hypothetical protein
LSIRAKHHDVTRKILEKLAEKPCPWQDVYQLVRDAYLSEVYSFAFWGTGSMEDACRVCAAVFVKLRNEIRAGRESSVVPIGVYQITSQCLLKVMLDIHGALNWEQMQRLLGEGPAEEELLHIDILGKLASKPESRLTGERHLVDAMMNVDIDQRIILLLHDMLHATIEEIGMVLDLSVGTVETRLGRARIHFRGLVTGVDPVRPVRTVEGQI